MTQQPPDAARYFAALGMAGAAYPWIVTLSVAIWSVLQTGTIELEFISKGFLALVCTSGVGAMLSVFGSLIAIMFCTGLFALFRLPTGGVRFHSFSAGLLGFAPSMAFVAYMGLLGGPWFEGPSVDWTEFLVLALLGPGVATLLFQWAGAWSTWPADGRLPPMCTWQFGIRQILIVTVWAALTLTPAKLTWPLSLWVGGWLLAWLVYQSFTIWLVLALLNWRIGRRGGFEGGGGAGGGMRE